MLFLATPAPLLAPVNPGGRSHPVWVKPNPKRPPLDELKPFIAKYESAGGRLKVLVNRNRTVDCGLYHINSSHFAYKANKEINRIFNKIFTFHGYGTSLHERISAAITDDHLNEDLTRALYNLKGIKEWVSWPKIMRDYKLWKSKAAK